jgi:hypothetical protein
MKLHFGRKIFRANLYLSMTDKGIGAVCSRVGNFFVAIIPKCQKVMPKMVPYNARFLAQKGSIWNF